MLQRWSLSRKLTAMIAIPVVVLMVFAGLDLVRRARITADMGSLEDLTLLAMASSRVGGALHQERSLTAGGDANVGDLQIQRGRTDEAVAELAAGVSAAGGELRLGDLAEPLEAALSALEQLEDLRQRVDSGELATVAAVSTYNDLSRVLLPVVTAVAGRSSDVEVKSMLLSLDLLARIREAADLERAALNFAFSSGTVSRGVMQAAGETIARQDTLEQLFLSQAPPPTAASYREEVLGDVTEEVRTFRLLAEESVEADEVDVDARQWWRVSSLRISAMGDVEEELVAATIERVGQLRAAAKRAAWLGAVVVVLAVGGVVVLSTFVARGVDRSLTRATDTIRETVAQITSSVQQLSASTGETAAAVSQTSTTVDELRQTSEAAARKARSTSESADESRSASGRARSSSERGVTSMSAIRTEVEGIAERIVDLSERNAQISDIVQNVNAIAEQSNLLAVNASIEAAKAGEHGRGFAVVAAEVRTLAERSKEATEQIRSILGEIQRSSNAAVMATEQGVKRVDEGSGVIDELGEVVQSLAMTIEEGAEASQQISLISSQQLAGIEQITEALRSVEQAASDNAAGAEQLAQAAKRLAEVSGWIATIVAGAGAGVTGNGR